MVQVMKLRCDNKKERIMRLVKFRLQNYRGYKDVTASFDNFTTIVGVNDVGKTTLLEALDVFFWKHEDG